MVYYDTNVYVYAFCKNTDDKNQKTISNQLIKKALSDNTLLVSEMILYEFAFVSKKLKENEYFIEQNLKFLSRFIKPTNSSTSQRAVSILNNTKLYDHSFDIFHIAFCEYYSCSLLTFDKGFEKLRNIAQVHIDIQQL